MNIPIDNRVVLLLGMLSFIVSIIFIYMNYNQYRMIKQIYTTLTAPKDATVSKEVVAADDM